MTWGSVTERGATDALIWRSLKRIFVKSIPLRVVTVGRRCESSWRVDSNVVMSFCVSVRFMSFLFGEYVNEISGETVSGKQRSKSRIIVFFRRFNVESLLRSDSGRISNMLVIWLSLKKNNITTIKDKQKYQVFQGWTMESVGEGWRFDYVKQIVFEVLYIKLEGKDPLWSERSLKDFERKQFKH